MVSRDASFAPTNTKVSVIPSSNCAALVHLAYSNAVQALNTHGVPEKDVWAMVLVDSFLCGLKKV